MINGKVKIVKIRLTPAMQDALSYLDADLIAEMVKAALDDIVADSQREEFPHNTGAEYALKEAFYSLLYPCITVEDEE